MYFYSPYGDFSRSTEAKRPLAVPSILHLFSAWWTWGGFPLGAVVIQGLLIDGTELNGLNKNQEEGAGVRGQAGGRRGGA